MAGAKRVAKELEERRRRPLPEQRIYRIHFYKDENGREPAREFMRALPGVKRRAIGVAIGEVLEKKGADVCKTDYGKSLGAGLYEFRVDQSAEETLRKAGKTPRSEIEDAKILIRVFFHVHGEKIVLLLSGYDKAELSSKTHQNEQIEEARRLLRDWKRHEREVG
jgi:phage-related protein